MPESLRQSDVSACLIHAPLRLGSGPCSKTAHRLGPDARKYAFEWLAQVVVPTTHSNVPIQLMKNRPRCNISPCGPLADARKPLATSENRADDAFDYWPRSAPSLKCDRIATTLKVFLSDTDEQKESVSYPCQYDVGGVDLGPTHHWNGFRHRERHFVRWRALGNPAVRFFSARVRKVDRDAASFIDGLSWADGRQSSFGREMQAIPLRIGAKDLTLRIPRGWDIPINDFHGPLPAELHMVRRKDGKDVGLVWLFVQNMKDKPDFATAGAATVIALTLPKSQLAARYRPLN